MHEIRENAARGTAKEDTIVDKKLTGTLFLYQQMTSSNFVDRLKLKELRTESQYYRMIIRLGNWNSKKFFRST